MMGRSRFRSRWLALAIGVAAVFAGVALTLKPFSSLDALTLFIGVGLSLAGIGEILARGDGRASSRFVGVALVATGLAALLLSDQAIRLVAIVVGIGLIVSGLARLWGVIRSTTSERYAALAGGLAAIVFGALALAWRDVTILTVALVTGPVAVILGLLQILRAIRWPDDDAPVPQPTAERTSRLGAALRGGRATLALLVALALIVASAFLHRGMPRLDAFYDAPADLPATPGQLLRHEPFERGMPDQSRAERFLYTTRGLDGSVEVASALVIVPDVAAPGPWPVILWAHGTSGIARQCAPSNLADPLGAGAMPARQEAIDRGWAIVAPDYLGLGGPGPHPYLVGAPVARSSLDAVRAARQIDGLALGDDTVVWGHSQGGAVTLWIGSERATYAPDVSLAGVVAMAPASDLPALAEAVLESRIAQLFGVYIVAAYSDVYPEVRVADYVRPSARAVAESIAGRCLSEPSMLLSLAAVLPGESIFSRLPADGPLGARLVENVPRDPSGLPTFLAQGLSDTIIDAGSQAGFVDGLCSAGQVVEYVTYAGRDHLGVVADDSPLIADLLSWTADRFANRPAATTCLTTQR